MPNIRDVAKEAGVSISTVSRYINKGTIVSDETGKKIECAIKKIGYTPSALGRAIFTKRTNKIGVILPSLNNPYFTHLLVSLETELAVNGYGISLYNSEYDKDREKKAIQELVESRVDGIITVRPIEVSNYTKLQIPLISIETVINEDVPCVLSDNYLGGKLAIEHLINRNAKRILYIEKFSNYLSLSDRKKGVIETANESGLSVEIRTLDTQNKLFSSEDLEDFFINIETYDGIIAYNDVMAVMVIKYLSNHNYYNKLGKDIYVIGYDDSIVSRLMNPSLTTISQKTEEISKTCLTLLTSLFEDRDVNYKTIIPVELIARDSTIR